MLLCVLDCWRHKWLAPLLNEGNRSQDPLPAHCALDAGGGKFVCVCLTYGLSKSLNLSGALALARLPLLQLTHGLRVPARTPVPWARSSGARTTASKVSRSQLASTITSSPPSRSSPPQNSGGRRRCEVGTATDLGKTPFSSSAGACRQNVTFDTSIMLAANRSGGVKPTPRRLRGAQEVPPAAALSKVRAVISLLRCPSSSSLTACPFPLPALPSPT